MPVIESTYRPPALLTNGHLQTIYTSLFRRTPDVPYERERILTPDDDFLDLDWLRVGERKVAILSHGLEGNTQRDYMKGMARTLTAGGWDVLAWNFRGCSGEPNQQLYSYHSGATHDLHTVISHVLENHSYSEIALIGFSLGGNMTLKYLGERGANVYPQIKRAVAFSVPIDLASSGVELAKPANRMYMIRFLRYLREKLEIKQMLFPGEIDLTDYNKIKDFQGFDDRYTAPLHGFRDAQDYWAQSSSKQFLTSITVPTLLINAKNDPFLSEECFPLSEAEQNGNFFLEVPASGGHVGFITFGNSGHYWSEARAAVFLNSENPETVSVPV